MRTCEDIYCEHKYIENGVMEYKCLLCSKVIKSHFAIECLLDPKFPLRGSEESTTRLLREYINK